MQKRIFLFLLILGIISSWLVFADVENVSNSSVASEDASVAVNSAGEIGVIWVEKFSSGEQHIYFSIRRNGKWSNPTAIPGQSTNNADPCIARGISGGFAAAWHDQAFSCIRFSQYQGSWSTPITISQIGGYQLSEPSITTTNNGRIAVGWMRGDPTFHEIFVTTFQNGWSGPVNVSNTPYSSKRCDLASGPNGQIYAVWQDNLYNPSNNEDFQVIMINNDQGNGRWIQSAYIDDIREWCFRPVVAVNSQNNVVVCYYYFQLGSYWGTHRLNGSWQTPQGISDVGNHHEHDRYISDNCAYGNDGFLYVYRDCGFNICYTVAQNGNFGNGVALTSSYQCSHPSTDYDPSVGAVAAWTDHAVGNGDVFVSIFDPDDSTPPPPPPAPDATPLPPLSVEANYLHITLTALNPKTELVINRNLFTVQYFRKITWAFDNNWTAWNIALSKYRIYRKLKNTDAWEFLGEVSPSVLTFIDKNGVTNEDRFDYHVRGVDNLGNDFYAYNLIRWAPNPANTEKKITVQGYNAYRKLSGQSSDSYILWMAVDASTNLLEDYSTEIRQQTQYDYAVSTISDKGKESIKAEALKYSTTTRKARKQ
jgi:hypothetical protein